MTTSQIRFLMTVHSCGDTVPALELIKMCRVDDETIRKMIGSLELGYVDHLFKSDKWWYYLTPKGQQVINRIESIMELIN